MASLPSSRAKPKANNLRVKQHTKGDNGSQNTSNAIASSNAQDSSNSAGNTDGKKLEENDSKDASDQPTDGGVIVQNVVNFVINVDASLLTDEMMKREKKQGTIQVSYEFHKEQIRSELCSGPSLSHSSSHKATIDDEMLQYLSSTPLLLHVVWRHVSSSTVARSPSLKKKANTVVPSASSSSTSKIAVPSSPSSYSTEFSLRLDMSELLSVSGETYVQTKYTTADGVLPFGINDLSIRLTADIPILTPSQKKILNPMTITILSAKNLPFHPFKDYTQMHTECLPVYAMYKLLDEQQVATSSIPQSSTIKWSHKKTIFVGQYDQREFVEFIENTPFRVEVHDRDRRSKAASSSQKNILVVNHSSSRSPLSSLVDDVPGSPCTNNTVPVAVSEIDQFDSQLNLLPATALPFSSMELTDVPRLTKTLDSYGVAVFSLSDLCRGENTLKLQSEILPNAHPSSHALSLDSQEYLPFKHGSVHTPGLYVPSESTLTIKVEISHAIASDNTKQPFCRAFYIFKNGEHTETLKRVLFTVQDVNSKALKIDVASEMTSATLHSRLLMLCAKPGGGVDQHQADALDIITGFQVIDSESVILCLEGLADKGMKLLESRIQRPGPNSKTFKVLSNMDIRFHSRLYSKGGGLGLNCIKSIRLSDPLSVILQQKQIYFRKLSNECYQAIHNIQHIVGLSKLYEVKAMHLFLDYSMLTALERYFGIPLEDEATPNVSDGSNKAKEVMLEIKPKPIEHKQKTVDIPYIKLNSWALLQKMKQ